MLFVAILASVFHFKIYFEDVLALKPATDFGLKIQPLRIVFEPFLGPLLFFNRSIYPLREIFIALLWLLLFLVSISIFKSFKNKDFKRKRLLQIIVNIPLLCAICFGIFVIILFVPLPNNTIVNNSKNDILVTTHAHTEFSHDGLISQENMWKWHERNGFDAFFITDHANNKKTLEFAKKQQKEAFPKDPLVLVGQEYSASNHMSLLGLNGAFETKGLEDKAVIDSVHKYGGAVIINHWFDGKGKDKEHYKKLGADGFEIENVGSDLYYNRDTFKTLREFCEHYNLIMVGGLDFHGYGRACSIYNAFNIPNWHSLDFDSKELEILKILKSRSQDKLKVIIYKDRTFYSDTNLILQPFVTLVNYFRTLNGVQVLSWLFWLVILQMLYNNRKKIPLQKDLILPVLAFSSTLLFIVLALIYHFKGIEVKGYSKVYAEYASLLGSIGTVVLIYILIVIYFRFYKHNDHSVIKH